MDELQKVSDEKDDYAQRCHDLDLQVCVCQTIESLMLLGDRSYNENNNCDGNKSKQ